LQPAKTAEKIFAAPLKVLITSVIDANDNQHTSRRYTIVFSFGDEIYDDLLLLN